MNSTPKSLIKPDDIVYGLLDKPPFFTSLLLAIQQLFVILPYVVLVTVLAKAANASLSEAMSMISLSLIAMGVGALLQVIKKGPLGSGYLAAVCPMPNYLLPSLIAVKMGGLGLMAGMVCFSGLCQIGLGWFIKKLRFLFPNVLTGLVFCMIGIDMAELALKQILNVQLDIHSIEYIKSLICFGLALSLIIIFNVWGRGLFRLLCSGLGLIIGAVIAYFLGLFTPDKMAQLHSASWFALPHFHLPAYHFSFDLILIFVIASVASVLRGMGTITTAQEINDANWRRPDNSNLKRGLFADGLAATFAGLVGTMGIGCTPSSVGVSKACGATSRRIAYFIVVLCFILALCPKLAALFFALPSSVIAAGLIFTSCILFIGGLRIITATQIDARKTFIVCIALFAGLSTELFPAFYQQFPTLLQPIVSSLLTFGTITAFILNLIFRIGIKRSEHLVFDSANDEFEKDLKARVTKLGLRPAASDAILTSFAKVAQLIIEGRHNKGPVKGTFSYDEVNFVISLYYEGSLVTMPSRKNYLPDDLDEENAFIEGINTLYKNFFPDRVVSHMENGIVTIRLQFAV